MVSVYTIYIQSTIHGFSVYQSGQGQCAFSFSVSLVVHLNKIKTINLPASGSIVGKKKINKKKIEHILFVIGDLVIIVSSYFMHVLLYIYFFMMFLF